MRIAHLMLTALLVFCCRDTFAQLTVSGGVEHFSWEEETRPAVSEDGLLLVLGLGYSQRVPEGWVWTYQGRFWTGSVEYNGSTLFTNQPLTGTTNYAGFQNEAQLRWRNPADENGYRKNLVLGLGIDEWRRELTARQYEDYRVVYLRMGIEAHADSEKSWLFSAGLKYPLNVQEDAHLTNIGFDRNPSLHPGGKISPYAEVGYRIDQRWRIKAYLDGYRFSRSDTVNVIETENGFGPTTIYQPASDMVLIGIRAELHLN